MSAATLHRSDRTFRLALVSAAPCVSDRAGGTALPQEDDLAPTDPQNGMDDPGPRRLRRDRRLYLRAATQPPTTAPDGGPKPVSDGDRGPRSGTARADELHAGGHNGDVRGADGALGWRKSRRGASAQRVAQRALRFEQPPGPGCHYGPDKAIARGCPSQTAGRRHLGTPGGDEPGTDPRREPVPAGVLSAAASEASGGRLRFSAFRHRRAQAAG